MRDAREGDDPRKRRRVVTRLRRVHLGPSLTSGSRAGAAASAPSASSSGCRRATSAGFSPLTSRLRFSSSFRSTATVIDDALTMVADRAKPCPPDAIRAARRHRSRGETRSGKRPHAGKNKKQKGA